MIKIICSILIGYLLGSIPFALVIGKVFYNTDIRQSGSGNLGGTNAGRVLGKKAGIAVIVCDVLKVVLAVGLSSLLSSSASILTGVACCIGHCYPVFAHFKGGKAVSTLFGFLLSISIFTFQDAWYFIGPFILFFIMLYLFKFVSLASICAALYSSVFITSELFSLDVNNIIIIIASWLMTILVIYRHRSNMERIKQGNENKISWM
ncbi:glycerol-3-phosphate 1-O-acyltransferase PlsY [Floccifex sp.]|uniref:glycerol-3-phosphate 1-O-acyltransferase PlsY n=1 Tax=Floccifex sp. TaxID=2815810 RepID=UPI003F09F195